MAKAWSLYLPEVLPDVPGCPNVMAINAVRNAAIEFCEKSLIWRYDFAGKIALVAAQATYPLTSPAGSNVAMITRLGFWPTGATKAKEVTGPVGHDELDRIREGWREETNVGVNSIETFTADGNNVRVVPIPVANQADAVSVSAALKPTRASTDGPDMLYDDWLEWIAHGAKWKLMATPKKDWTDLELATYHKNQFEIGIARAGAKIVKGGGQRRMTIQPRTLGK